MLTFETSAIQGVTGIVEKLTVSYSGQNQHHAKIRQDAAF